MCITRALRGRKNLLAPKSLKTQTMRCASRLWYSSNGCESSRELLHSPPLVRIDWLQQVAGSAPRGHTFFLVLDSIAAPERIGCGCFSANPPACSIGEWTLSSERIARPAGVQGARSDRAGLPDRAVQDDQEALLCTTHCKTQSKAANPNGQDHQHRRRFRSIDPALPGAKRTLIATTPAQRRPATKRRASRTMPAIGSASTSSRPWARTASVDT
jgi:hypothetical protein